MKFLSISSIVLISLILLRYFSVRPDYKNGDHVRITSRVYSEPINYDRQQYLTLQGLKIYLPKYPEISYGETIVVEGVVEEKILKNPKLILISDSRFKIFDLREKLILFYKNSLPEPYASLIAGITIGSKNMPESFWNKLKSTGTAHVVVASGTNVTMLATFLISTLTYLFNRKRAVFMTLTGIVGYIVLSGFDAPIIRAGIMGSIVFLAQNKGRLVNSWRLLIYCAGIMLLIKPIWITDLGFRLSTSLAAQIGVAPIIYVTFGQFNMLSPVINALILWTIPYIMILGALGGIVGLVVPLVGRLILFMLFPLLWWFVEAIQIFG